ncbi:LOW QUALITY PROTEIN: centriolar satellite-associated tubulin polyglutamylase complex regulator 1 [Cottoperca gobio]|uniref:Centriolar satellite-associated tubulin polyglutamylase complex regulator 1 n=1 Tax=Cottoperca gobio TaxID=56716 RepID=A0A6J2PY07_COTGO|nr:LOW QUALITY PROTEIN: UPF0705 protein C11orf49 homolog [Cottoperca gobio]
MLISTLSPERTTTMNRFSSIVPDDEYLADSNVLFYLSDTVTQLLEHKEEYSHFGVIRYFAEYFSSVKNSNHVLFREYNYIRATPHNRASFIRVFWRCYRQIGKSGDLLSMLEYRSLLQLLCPDFPLEMVQNAARIVLMDDAIDCMMSFSDFLFALQLQFYYQEFLDSVLGIYQDLLAGKSPNTVIVPTSTSIEQSPLWLQRRTTRGSNSIDGVEPSTLAQCIDALCDRFKCSHPPRSCMRQVLEQTNKVSYYSFLMSLAKHEAINQTIGALPSKAELLIDPEMDQELDKLIAQISVSPGSNSSGSAVGGLKEMLQRKASPRRNIHHRRKIEVESDGSTEETDSSEN